MPREIVDQELLVNAVRGMSLTAELFEELKGKAKYAGDQEVILQGRAYDNGKKVGPYVRLLVYEGGETIMRQGEWGGNTFYMSVAGKLDVSISDSAQAEQKIGELHPGTCFGEMAVLAGIERNATVSVPRDRGSATVLEVTRPALRLLRKLPKFGHALDDTYRSHGFARVLADLNQGIKNPLDRETVEKLRGIARFMVYGKHHVICQEDTAIENIILIKSGWVRRIRGIPLDPASSGVASMGGAIGVDFLGSGNCLGLEGTGPEPTWKYSASVLARTEVLEIPLAPLGADTALRDRIVAAFSAFSLADDLPPAIEAVKDLRSLAAAEHEISTGVVDGANLLVMDMDLCVRCGNCSLACHKVHGQSRLLRRGIHIARPVKIGSERIQHVLSPQVCMHCKDPECLTGCPTGAIFRDPRGYVDISAATCIGCFDCATQCPYDAITMVPRNGGVAPAVEFELMGSLKRAFSLRVPQGGLPLTPSDDVVAIKCNLCEHTTLNPQGAIRQAYSCEENCPTGALVRVDPLKYFAEVESTQGIVFRNETQAFGRNIHKSDPLAKAFNIVGVGLTAAATLAVIWGLARYGFDGVFAGSWLTMRWLTGLVGLLGVAAVMTYPLRKQVYRKRAGALRYWMLFHVYLGALTGVVLLLHAGTRTGSLLTTVLYLAFDAVIVSGLVGIASYIIVPRILTSIEGDPLLVEDLVARRDELKSDFKTIAEQSEGWLREEIESRVAKRFQTFSFLMRQIIRREPLTSLLAEAREPFKARVTRLATAEERDLLIKSVETAVTIRRLDALIALHKLLKIWVAPHVLSTALMLALMIVHVVQVIYFAVGK